VPLLAGSKEPSLTQLTDEAVLADHSCFSCVSTCYCLSFQCRHWRTASSAHTYRLLVVKEPADSFCCLPLALRIGPAAAKRCVRQQQRNEIMQHLLSCVNLFLRCASKKLPSSPALFSSPPRCFAAGDEL